MDIEKAKEVLMIEFLREIPNELAKTEEIPNELPDHTTINKKELLDVNAEGKISFGKNTVQIIQMQNGTQIGSLLGVDILTKIINYLAKQYAIAKTDSLIEKIQATKKD